MDWIEPINCQTCISLNKKLELFDLLKQKCCKNDDIARNLLCLKKAYEKSTRVLESKSKKLVEVRNKLKDAGKNEEILKRKVAEFQLRLVTSDTKYQDILKDIEVEREKFISLSKAKNQLEDILQSKENEVASLLLISKQSEERHENEVLNLKSEIEKSQEAAKAYKEFRQSHKKLKKLENQLDSIYKDGFDLSKKNQTKLKRIVNRISSQVSARKLEAELNSPSMTPDGTPSLDTGIFSDDEDFENPLLDNDLVMSSESSDDDFEDLEETRKEKLSFSSREVQKVHSVESSYPESQLSLQPICDNSSSCDSFADNERTTSTTHDLTCENSKSNLVGSPLSTSMADSKTPIEPESSLNKRNFSPKMKSSVELPCVSQPTINSDTSLEITDPCLVQNVALSQKLEDCCPKPNVLHLQNLSSKESLSCFSNSGTSPLGFAASSAFAITSSEGSLKAVEHDSKCRDATPENNSTVLDDDLCHQPISPKDSISKDLDSFSFTQQPERGTEISKEKNVSKNLSLKLADTVSHHLESPSRVAFPYALPVQLSSGDAECLKLPINQQQAVEVEDKKASLGLISNSSSKDNASTLEKSKFESSPKTFSSLLMGVPGSEIDELSCPELSVPIEKSQGLDQVKEKKLESESVNELIKIDVTADSVSTVNKTLCNVSCAEATSSPSKFQREIQLLHDESRSAENKKDSELTSCDLDTILDEWKPASLILPFSDDSCGFDDDNMLAESELQCSVPSNDNSNSPPTKNNYQVSHESSSSTTTKTVSSISVATNTEEIKLSSVALSPISKFQHDLTFQMSQNSSVTLPFEKYTKESGISPIWSSEDKAVSPIKRICRDVGVMPIKELRKDSAVSPLKTRVKSAGTSPDRSMFNDSAVSPIRAKRLDAACGSTTLDKSTQVNITECLEDSQTAVEQINLHEWSEEVKFIHRSLEKLGINSKDLATVVTDKYYVEELKKTLNMALKSSCHPFVPREPVDRCKSRSFCSFEPCEFAELCNQQHYNLHLLAKSKNLEKQMCKLRNPGKHKIKRLKKANQKRRKTLRFTEEVFTEKESQLCVSGSTVESKQNNLDAGNHTLALLSSLESTCTQAHSAGPNTEPQPLLTKGIENLPRERDESDVNSIWPTYHNVVTPNSSFKTNGKRELTLSVDLPSKPDQEKVFEMDSASNSMMPNATLKNRLSENGNAHLTETISCEKGIENTEISPHLQEIECATKTNVNDNSSRKNSRKRQSSSSDSGASLKEEFETSNSKLSAPLRRSPRVKRVKVAHEFDSKSRNSYQKGYVKFVKGESIFVRNESETPSVEEKRSSDQEESNTSVLRSERALASHPMPSTTLPKPNLFERKSKVDCNGSSSLIFNASERKRKSYNHTTRTGEAQLKPTGENKLKRHKVLSPKISSDDSDSIDDDKLIISCETDDSEQEINLTAPSSSNNQSVNTFTCNDSSSKVGHRIMEDCNEAVSPESRKRSEKLNDSSSLTTVSQCKPKAACGKMSKLQRMRSSVSKIHPLAQATRSSRPAEETERDQQKCERIKRMHTILSSSSPEVDQIKLSPDVLEKFRGREVVRMAAATSGRTAQLIQIKPLKSRQKATVACNSTALGKIKPVSNQPLVRPEDRLLSAENVSSLKERKEQIQIEQKTNLLVENILDPVQEPSIRKEIQQSSFLITEDIEFKVTTLSPIAYAISEKHTSETHPCNKHELKRVENLVQDTLKKFVAATSFTSDKLQEAIDILSQPGLENVKAVLVRDVVKMMDDDFDTPPLPCGKQQKFAPPLTPVQQQLLTLVLQLSFQQQHLKQLPHEVLRLLEFRMFRLGNAPEGHRLQWCSRFYAAICRALCLRSEALIFCWDALYSLKCRSYDVVKAVMDVWPYLFPINPNFEKACPNAQVMLHVLKCQGEKPSAEQNSNKFDSSWLKRMLRSSGLQSTSINSTILSSKLFSNLIDRNIDANVTAIVLLAKREEEQWTMKSLISGNFLPALEKWRIRSLDNAAGERVIWTMCSILRALPPERHGNTSHSVLKLLKSELLQKDHRLLTPQMQEVIAIGLALLSKHDIETVAHSLMSWSPNHGSSKGYSSRLLQYLSSIICSGSRPLSWWQSQLNQLPKSNLEE